MLCCSDKHPQISVAYNIENWTENVIKGDINMSAKVGLENDR